MSDKNKMNNETLKEVSGGFLQSSQNKGGFSIKNDDHCHLSPSCWVHEAGLYFPYEEFKTCSYCAYNTHRDWKDSTCDYPNKH